MPWNTSKLSAVLFIVALFAVASHAAEESGADWNQFLGPNRNGVSEGPKLAEKWGPQGPPVLWKTACQFGFSGPSIKDGVLVLLERGPKPKAVPSKAPDDATGAPAFKWPDETVRGIDIKTGAELWHVSFPSDAKAEPHGYFWGSCSTPATLKDRVICQFLDGHLRCLELKSGKTIWEKDLATEFGMTKKGAEPTFQACSSPLLAGDQVVIMVCTDTIGLLSLSVSDGKEVWRTPSFGNYGSSLGFMKMGDTNVVIAVPCSVDRKLFKDGDVLAFNAMNGELLWTGNASKSYYNTPPPIANDGLLMVEGGSGDGPTFAFTAPNAGGAKAELLWKDNDHLVRWSNYLIYHGVVFGQGFHAHGPKKDIGIRLFCNDAKAGKNFWHTEAKERHQSMIGSDNKVFQLHENGELSMFDASARDGYKELGRARVVAQKGGVWSFPALVQGHLYVRTDSELVCLDLTEK